MARSGSGWWFARGTEMQGALDRGASLEEVARAEGVTTRNVRRLLAAARTAGSSAEAHGVAHVDVRANMLAWEAFNATAHLGPADPLLAASVLRGEVTAARVQEMAREARLRASLPAGAADLSLVEIRAACGTLPVPQWPDGRPVVDEPAATAGLGLAADSTHQTPDGVEYAWALVAGPGFRASPLHGLNLPDFFLRLAAVLLIFNRVHVACASAYEEEQVRLIARLYRVDVGRCEFVVIRLPPPAEPEG